MEEAQKCPSPKNKPMTKISPLPKVDHDDKTA